MGPGLLAQGLRRQQKASPSEARRSAGSSPKARRRNSIADGQARCVASSAAAGSRSRFPAQPEPESASARSSATGAQGGCGSSARWATGSGSASAPHSTGRRVPASGPAGPPPRGSRRRRWIARRRRFRGWRFSARIGEQTRLGVVDRLNEPRGRHASSRASPSSIATVVERSVARREHRATRRAPPRRGRVGGGQHHAAQEVAAPAQHGREDSISGVAGPPRGRGAGPRRATRTAARPPVGPAARVIAMTPRGSPGVRAQLLPPKPKELVISAAGRRVRPRLPERRGRAVPTRGRAPRPRSGAAAHPTG